MTLAETNFAQRVKADSTRLGFRAAQILTILAEDVTLRMTVAEIRAAQATRWSSMDKPSCYNAVCRLELQGRVSSEKRYSKHVKGGWRRYYAITEAGRQILATKGDQ